MLILFDHERKILLLVDFRSSPLEVFLGKGVLKKCSKFLLENTCRIALRHGCFPVNLLHIFRRPFLRAPLKGYFCDFFWYQKDNFFIITTSKLLKLNLFRARKLSLKYCLIKSTYTKIDLNKKWYLLWIINEVNYSRNET